MAGCRHDWGSIFYDTEHPRAEWGCTKCRVRLSTEPDMLLSDQAEAEALRRQVQGLRATCRQGWRMLYMACSDDQGKTQLVNSDINNRSVNHVMGMLHAAATTSENSMLLWAVERWTAEVAHRPLINVHRRTLDDTWRQVITYLGGNPNQLLGPDHDTLVELNHEENKK